jgi:hypothetical protein
MANVVTLTLTNPGGSTVEISVAEAIQVGKDAARQLNNRLPYVVDQAKGQGYTVAATSS